MALKMVAETEVPEAETARASIPVPAKTEPKLKESSETSPHLTLMLAEIRRVLNARAGALMAMGMAFLLTTVAMFQATAMALAISISFDTLICIPILLIAYRQPKG